MPRAFNLTAPPANSKLFAESESAEAVRASMDRVGRHQVLNTLILESKRAFSLFIDRRRSIQWETGEWNVARTAVQRGVPYRCVSSMSNCWLLFGGIERFLFANHQQHGHAADSAETGHGGIPNSPAVSVNQPACHW